MEREKLIEKIMNNTSPMHMIAQLRKHMQRLDSEFDIHLSGPTTEQEKGKIRAVLISVKLYLEIVYILMDTSPEGVMSQTEKQYFEAMKARFDEVGL